LFNVFEDAGFGRLPVLIAVMMHPFGFKLMKETFCHGIVVAVAFAAHAAQRAAGIFNGIIAM
jgi:hypothetical protein